MGLRDIVLEPVFCNEGADIPLSCVALEKNKNGKNEKI